MQNLKKLVSTLLLLPAFLLVFQACKKDETPEIKQGDIHFQFNYTVDGEAFNTGQNYMINGVAVNFEFAHFYIGGIKFHPEDGEHIAVEDTYFLVTPDNNEFHVATLDEGHYHMANFVVGVEDVENAQTEADFTSRSASDPLGMQTPSMHWGWNGGYRYIRIDGMVDTDGDGEPESSLAFHLGNFDAFDFLSNQSLEIQKDLAEGNNHVNFKFDLAKLFAGIDLKTEHSTHVFNNEDLAKRFHTNLATAFSVHH